MDPPGENPGTVRTIRAGRVLVAPDAPPLGPTEIAIDAGGRIAALRPLARGGLTAGEAALLVTPALANAHDHGRGVRTLAHGTADQPLETWVHDLARAPRVDPYLLAAVALGRLAESGVAAVNHCHNTQDGAALLAEAEAVSRAARDVGITVAFGWPFFDRNPVAYGDIERLAAELPEEERRAVLARRTGMRSCAENMALMARAEAFEHPLFRLQYQPVAPQWARHETLAAIARASAESGRRVHTHLLETERQREWADARYPDGLLAHLDAIGLLSSRLTVAHAVWLRPDECALLAARGVTVSINLSSNLRLRSGAPPVAALLRAGTPLAIGLDGAALDDDEDMLRELRLVRLGFARAAPARPALDARTVLDGAWSVGRRTILGADGGGRIAPGAPADLLMLDFAALSADCVTDDPDPATLLLGRAQRRHVVRLVVGGRDVVARGRCTRVDLPALEAALVAEARAAHRAEPPDAARIDRLRGAAERHYRDGRHRDDGAG